MKSLSVELTGKRYGGMTPFLCLSLLLPYFERLLIGFGRGNLAVVKFKYSKNPQLRTCIFSR